MIRDREHLLARDARARAAARTRQHGVVVVEAGAGTGKTSLLVARVLVWSLGAGWEATAARAPGADDLSIAARLLDRLVAITFTDKAAAEMTTRITRALDCVRSGREAELPGFAPAETGATAAERARRAEALLLAGEHLQVSTIHAWCRRLLQSWSLEAGLHPAGDVDADQMRVSAVVDELLLEILAEAYGRPAQPDYLRLARAELGPGELATALHQLAAADVPPELLRADPHAAEQIAGFQRAVAARLGRFCARLEAGIGGSTDRHLERARELHAVVAALRDAAAGPLAGLIESFARIPERVLRRLQDYAKGRWSKAEQNAFGAAVEALGDSAYALLALRADLDGFDLELFAAARRVLADLLARVRQRLDARGVLSFQALLQRTHELLVGDPAIAAAVRRGIDQLLVDEFQDTDRLQCGILRAIALSGPAAERPGLFLVGDPKQSIYGWRNADLAAYDGFVEAALAGEAREPLLVNFRSTPAVLDEVERVCARQFFGEPGLQAAWEPLIAGPARAAEIATTESPRVEHWVSWDVGPDDQKSRAKTGSDRARELEARLLVRDLRQRHQRGELAWRDCALLLRSLSQADVYLEALRRAGIPFEVARESTFYQRREVVDAAALLRTVLDPSDRVALLAVLRAPFSGLPDAAVPWLWLDGLPDRIARLPDGDESDAIEASLRRAAARLGDAPAPADWPAGVLDTIRALGELRRAYAEQPADRFVALLRERLLLEPTAAARFLGLHRVATLQRLFRIVEQALLDPERGANALLRELRRGVDGLLRGDEGSPGEDGLDAVRVLTIHRAKGLEWPHVYVADLHHGLQHRTTEPPSEVVLLEGHAQMRLCGLPSLGWREVEARRAAVERAEAVRLLYVAMTRAADRLVLLGRWPAEDHGSEGRLIDLVAERPHPDLDALAADPRRDDGIVEDGVRWRIGTESDEISEELRPVPAPELEPLFGRARSLAERVAAAEARSRLPRTAAATAGGDEPVPIPTPADREAPDLAPADARALGVLFHRLLEQLRFDESTPDIERRLLQLAPPPLAALAREHLHALLRSPLWSRLTRLRAHLLARELPFVLAAAPGDPAVDAIAGSIDLLYRDPERGEIVIADYKTARTPRPELHRAQARAYRRAVQQALGLAEPPRFELWYLFAGEVVELASDTL